MLVIGCKLSQHQPCSIISSLMLYLKKFSDISLSYLWRTSSSISLSLATTDYDRIPPESFLFFFCCLFAICKKGSDGYGHSTLTCFLRKHTIHPTPASIAIGVPCKREHCVVFFVVFVNDRKGIGRLWPAGKEDGQNFCLSSTLSMKAVLLWPQ